MKKIVKEFYEKQVGYTKFFEKKKKISFDTSDKFVELIDRIAKLSSNSKTVIINALISDGISPFIKRLETTWAGFLKDEKYGKINKDLKNLLSELKKIKEEYQIPD